jgi:hypothetical protein
MVELQVKAVIDTTNRIDFMISVGIRADGIECGCCDGSNTDVK